MRTSSRLLIFLLSLPLLLVSAWLSPVWYDDAGHWHVARHLAETGDMAYAFSGAPGDADPASAFITMGPVLTYPGAALLRITGPEMWPLRLLVVGFSLGLLFLLHRLARDLHSPEKAFWALLLITGNVQFLTYGAEFLGEVPMLFWLMGGLLLHLRWIRTDYAGWQLPLLAGLCWGMALLTKEYIAVPLGLALLLACVLRLRAGELRAAAWIAVQGLLLPCAALLWYRLHLGSWGAVAAALHIRSSYGSEFFALSFGESLRYLCFKPVIWLGTLALLLKMRMRRSPTDLFLGSFHLIHLLLFLLSAGYDRFGFQLLFLPALYLAEYVQFTWKAAASRTRGSTLRRVLLVTAVVLLSFQMSLPLLVQRFLRRDEPAQAQEILQNLAHQQRIQAYFLYDQQYLLLLPAGMHGLLPRHVPSAAAQEPPLRLRPGQALIAGPYAASFYAHCIPAGLEEWARFTLNGENVRVLGGPGAE